MIIVTGYAQFRDVNGRRIRRSATFQSDELTCSLSGECINESDPNEFPSDAGENGVFVRVSINKLSLRSFGWSGKLGIEIEAECEDIKRA